MTKDDIKKMVVQLSGCDMPEDDSPALKMFIDFAKLVAEKEREACAKICDDRTTAYQYATDVWAQEHINEAKHLSQEIRARRQSNG